MVTSSSEKTYVRLNEAEKGLEQFKQAEKLDPDGADVHYWLATTYQRLGNQPEHLSEMKTFLSLNGKLPEQQRDDEQNHRLSSTCRAFGD